MSKAAFLKELSTSLAKLPAEERLDILQDYEEHFANGLADGKTEEEILTSLGTPNQIAKEILASYHLNKTENNTTTGNVFRAVWAVIGLGFFNLVIVLGPFLALVGVLVAGWAVGVSFTGAPVIVVLDVFIFQNSFQMFDLFISIALCGIGLFTLVGMYFATKAVNTGFLRYLRFNVSLVKGGLKHE
jgi:uncharacterized membrane protein